MEPAYVQTIEQILEYCPEKCKSRNQKVKDLCKVKDVELESFLQCMDKAPYDCISALYHDGSHHCLCSCRIYIAKAFKV